MNLTRALTFEDILLVPAYSEVLPKEVSTLSLFSKTVSLNVPFVSAAMDTVTEYGTAIAMARLGGLGIIHKNMDTESQVAQVRKVKKSESGIINDPVFITADKSLQEAEEIMKNYSISGVPVVDDTGRLIGILTNRDTRFERDFSRLVLSLIHI